MLSDFNRGYEKGRKDVLSDLVRKIEKLNVQNVLTDEFGYELGTLEINIGVAIKEKILELLEEK